nr:translocation/assembly module TamB domain-containing protein [Desulfobulbaceae bacterium]
MKHYMKFILRTLVFPACVLLVLAGLIYGSRFLLVNFAVQSIAIPFAEKYLPGLDLTIASVHSDLISSIEFKNILVDYRLEDGSNLHTDLPQLQVNFALSDLKINLSTLISKARIVADLQSARFDLQSASSTSSSYGFDLPGISFPLPSFLIRFESVVIARADTTIGLRAGEISVSSQSVTTENSVLPIGVTASRIDLSFGHYETSAEEVRVDSLYRPGSYEVALLTVGGEELARDLIVKSDGENISVKAEVTVWEGRSNFEAVIAEEARVTFSISGINLKKIDVVSSGDTIEKTGNLEGRGVLAFPMAEPYRLTGEVFFLLEQGKLFGVPIDIFRLQASAADGQLQITELSLKAQKDQIHIEKNVLPLEPVLSGNWSELVGKAIGHFELSIARLGKYETQLPEQVNAIIERHKVDTFQASGKLNEGVLSVPHLLLNSEKVSLRANGIEADLNPWSASKSWQAVPIKADIQIDSTDADYLTDFIPEFGPFKGILKANLQLGGEIGDLITDFSIQGQKITYKKTNLDFLDLSGTVRDREIDFDAIRAVKGQDALEGALSYSFMRPNDTTGTFKVKVFEIDNYLSEGIREQSQLQGDLTGELDFRRVNGRFSGEFAFDSDSLSYTGERIEQIKVDAQLSGNDLTIRSFTGRYPGQDFTVSSLAGEIAFNREWDQFVAYLNSFSSTYRGKNIVLLNSAQFSYQTGQISTLEPIVFQYEAGRASIAGLASTDQVDLRLTGDIADGADFMVGIGQPEFSFGTASMKVGIKGSLQDPAIKFSGNIKQIKAKDAPPLDGFFDVSLAAGTLKIIKFVLSDDVSPRLQLHGELPISIEDRKIEFTNGPLQLFGDIDLQSSPLISWFFHDKIVQVGTVSGKIDLHGTRQNPLGVLQLKADNLILQDSSGWLPSEPISVDIAVKGEKNKISVAQSTIVSDSSSIVLQGSIFANGLLDNEFWADGKESVLDAGLDLKGTITFKDISWLADRLELLRRISGRADADFKLTGTLANPLVDAQISLRNGAMRFSNDMPALQEVGLQAKIVDSVVTISHFAGSLGGAPLMGKGTISLLGDDGQVSLDLQVSGSDLLFYRSEGVTIRGDASLKVYGISDRPSIDGSIVLTDTRVTKNIDFISSLLSGFSSRATPPPQFPAFTDPPLRDAVFNLTLTSKEPVAIANNMLRGKITPQLELHGTGEVPFLTGKIYIAETNLVLPAGKVKMDAGVVQFLETDPDRPVLELNGTAKMMGYDIVIGISGVYDAPVIMLSSTPSLSNEELLMLLLAGKRPSGLNNPQNQSKNYSGVAVYLGENLLKSIWGSDTNETTVPDRLQIEIGKNITQQGEETIEAQFVLAENIRNGQNALLLTGEKDVWDKYNGGLRLVFKFK